MRRLGRMWRYITRSRAIGAWIMFGVAVLLYGLYPAEFVASDAVRQASLIVASIGLSAIFLPELSNELWSLKAEEIRALVPDDKVVDLQRAITHSRIRAREWADYVVDGAIQPLYATDLAPHTVVTDASYTVRVHPECSARLQEPKMDLSLFECTLAATRMLPARLRADVFWVTLARDYVSLRQEYNEMGCVYREVSVIDEALSDEEWRELALKYCSASVVIDGARVEATLDSPYPELASQNPRLARWFFVSSDLAKAVERPYRIEISFDYVQDSSVSSFPAMFSAYYIAGGLRFEFDIYPPEGRSLVLQWETFLAQALPHVVDESLTKKAVGQELRVLTNDASLIWPGSGVHVWWSLRPAATGSNVVEGLVK